MIARSDTSAIAAAVASPDRNECPGYRSHSNPAAFAQRFTIRATDWSVSRWLETLPWRSTLRKIGPLAMAAASSQARSERTGRSEEHTSELQSRLHLVCRLLLEN